MAFDNGSYIVGFAAEFSKPDAETAQLIMEKGQRKWREAVLPYSASP